MLCCPNDVLISPLVDGSSVLFRAGSLYAVFEPGACTFLPGWRSVFVHFKEKKRWPALMHQQFHFL